MKLLVFAVLDVKAEMYSIPFFKKSKAEAIRDFSDVANDRNTTVGRHPGDFKLVLLGTWSDTDSVFQVESHETMGFGSDFIQTEGLKVVS